MKYRIKDFEYVSCTNIVSAYINSIATLNETKEIIKGLQNLDIVPYDTEFELFNAFEENDGIVYDVLKCKYGLFIVREDNIEEIVEKEDILEQNSISKLIRSGNKTILIDEANNKYFVTKHPDDKEDLEKAVMILLLKKEGYTTNDIYALIDCVDRR